MKRLIEKMVFSGLVMACRLATWPTSRSPPFVKATTDGVVRFPSWLGITVGWPPSMTATTELVVPRSIPMILPIQISSLLRSVLRVFSPIPLSKLSVLLSSFFSVAFAQPSHTLLVAVASDLIDIQAPLAQTYTDQNGVRLLFTFGPSGQLAHQIANGAPYDVFLSADEDRVKDLDSVVVYAEGRIALWSKSGTIRKLDDLAALRHIAIANPA